MTDVLTFDQEKLFKNISNDSIPFRLFTRLMLGIIFVAFFGDDALRGDDGNRLEEEGRMFRDCARKMCLEMDDIKNVLKLLLSCPGLQNEDIADILDSIHVERDVLRRAVLEFSESESFDTAFKSRIEGAGWMKDWQKCVGRAHYEAGHVSFASRCLKRAGIPDSHNHALHRAEHLIKDVFKSDEQNFIRALKLETLHGRRLLSNGLDRRRLWSDIRNLLKEMDSALEQKREAMTKLDGFAEEPSMDRERYDLAVTQTQLLIGFPVDGKRTETLRFQHLVQRLLNHADVAEDVKTSVAMEALYALYVFGSQLPGYGIFERPFVKELLQRLKSSQLDALEDPQCARQLESILLSMHRQTRPASS